MDLDETQYAVDEMISDGHQILGTRLILPLLALFCVLAIFYKETFIYLFDNWTQWQHGEYAHGFSVLTVAVYMIWGWRDSLHKLELKPEYAGIFLALMFSLTWMTGVLVGIRVVESLSLFLLIPSMIYALAGRQFATRLWFPLAFILVAFPIWDPMLPVLQSFAASLAYWLVKLTGISVIKEGAYLTITDGQFLVAEGCSGLRYLLAAMTFGGFYIYLERLTHWRAISFFFIVIAAAILANALRITMVVIAGEMTKMQHPWIHDHLSLGWYIFAIMLLPVFFIGIKLGRLQEIHDDGLMTSSVRKPVPIVVEKLYKDRPKSLMILVSLLMLAAISGPWFKGHLLKQTVIDKTINLETASPGEGNGWLKSSNVRAQKNKVIPSFTGADHIVDQYYFSGEQKVRLYIAIYLSQRQDKELINVNNVLYDEEHWQPVNNHIFNTTTGLNIDVREVHLKNNHGVEYLIWSWYQSSGFTTTRNIMTKLFDLYGLMTGNTQSSVIMIAVEKQKDIDSTRQQLNNFLDGMYGSIEMSLDNLSKQN